MRIAQATQNPIIEIVLESIYNLLRKFIAFTFEYSPVSKHAIQKHGLFLNCFVKKDTEKACEVMKKHMQYGSGHVGIYYRKQSNQ